jgi:thiol-disulfide isomerase/thioredoxin
MFKVQSLLRGALCFAALISACAFAQTPAKDALKAITEHRMKVLTEARQSGKPVNIAVLNEGVKAKAEELIRGVEVSKVAPGDSYDWAQVFGMAGKHKEVCDLCTKFLTTNPSAEVRFSVQMLMMNSCNALGEGDMLIMTLHDIRPANAIMGRNLASYTARDYADTIAKTKGLDEALKSLDQVLAKMPSDDHKANAQRMLDAAKVREASNPPATAPKPDADRLAQFELTSRSTEAASKYSVIDKKADLLKAAGRGSEARALLKSFAASLDPSLPIARTVNANLKQMEMVGMPAPVLNVERGYGEFKGLESLKGKVVIIDFFAHWCGPCKASYPDMRKLYDDLNSKGLEMVGVTTYYGYYGQERGISKDAEFGKMAEFIKEFNIAWPVVYGERSNFEAYGVTGIPHVTVIDRKGNVHSIEIGYSPAIFTKFRAEIEKLINEK